ncbi:MAG: DUF5118 domain-containing protein, partial [Acidobacteriota bacterium]
MKTITLFVLAFLVACTIRAESLPKIGEKISGTKKFAGFFPFYWDTNAGKIWLEIDKLDQEFLYIHSLPAGVGSNDIGLDRGQLGDTR